MKTQKFYNVRVAKMASIALALPFLVVPVSEGEPAPEPIEAGDISRLLVRLSGIGETGIGKRIGTEGENRYEIVDSTIVLHLSTPNRIGTMTAIVDGQYGQISIHAIVSIDVTTDTTTEVTLADYELNAIAAGGGGDYKTNIYMDGDGRVVLERMEDGSTLLLDEHENPILKRNADGSTQYFDAYQSARLRISASGEVEITYTEDEATKTLAVAEAILARTQKRLLYNTAGETTIKDAEGNILTHADIYAMLMTSPDFVVLVRSDHAFHPNLVTPTQIAFTCSYFGASGQISAERVNITNEDVVTYISGNGITRDNNGNVVLGTDSSAQTAAAKNSMAQGQSCAVKASVCHAEGYFSVAGANYSHAEGNHGETTGVGSHAEGHFCKAKNDYAHAEGEYTNANGRLSHTEGNYTTTNGSTSHAEGNYCETGTNGGSAHAEGSYTNANGAASHTEGYRTTTTEGGSHAQGCWNKVEGGEYAFMHGCGTGAEDLCNAFLIAGDQVYMRGIGGYDGTNYGAEGVKSVQTVIRELQLKLINF